MDFEYTDQQIGNFTFGSATIFLRYIYVLYGQACYPVSTQNDARRAIGFSYRPVSFGRKNSEFI